VYTPIRFSRMLDFTLAAARPAAVELEAETSAWIAEVVNNGGSVSAGRQIVVNTLIAGLKTDGIWTKLDRLWLFAAENEESALTDLVGLTLATAVDSPTFTADDGYNGNGSSSYVDTTYNPATQGTNYVQNSASAGIWVIAAPAQSATAVAMGLQVGTDYAADLTLRYVDDNTYARINTAVDSLDEPTLGAGLYMIDRSGSNNSDLYKDGVSVDSGVAASVAVVSGNFFIGARNTGGSPGNYATDVISSGVFGGALSSTEHGNLYTHLQTYMTAVGL
jgi:hypothetical protein